MNKTVLIGRLTKDPELKFLPGNGTAVANFTLAVERRFSKEKEADFIPIVVFGKQAEATANYTSKGKLIGISGRIQTRNYDAKDGTKRYVTEVVADEVQFLEWAEKKDTSSNNGTSYEGIDEITPVDGEEIPF